MLSQVGTSDRVRAIRARELSFNCPLWRELSIRAILFGFPGTGSAFAGKFYVL
jgi:hypothetical protein